MDHLWTRLQSLLEQGPALGRQAIDIWIAGGWAMIAIAVVGMVMFGMGTHLYLMFWGKGFRWVSEKRWRRWISHPAERRGKIGQMLNLVLANRTLDEVSAAFTEIRSAELAPIERDLRIMRICVGAAPLLGLLGTVTGMLATFDALASGSGGEKTMGLIASGISEALITTETGLVIALPGLFFQYQMSRNAERYRAFLAHLETVCTQHVHHRARRPQPVLQAA